MGEPVNPVRRLWELMEERRWDEARAQLADDCRIDWPQTGERFLSAGAFTAMNQAHPAPNWHVRRVRTVLEDERCACEAVVESDDGVEVCLAFYELRDGRSQPASSTGSASVRASARRGAKPSPCFQASSYVA